MKLRELLKHRYTGYGLRILFVLVLVFGVFHVDDRSSTLNSGGCKAYWTEFGGIKDFSYYRLLSSEEKAKLLTPSKPEYNSNYEVK